MSRPAARPVDAPAPASDVALLGVAVVAVSTAAPLVRYASAPALAVAMWRNALALPVLAPAALRSRWPDRRERRLIALSGLFLAAHFAAWLSSISYTTIASSVALVSTQPAWAALIAHRRGEPVTGRVWAGIGIAFAGVLVLSGVDLAVSGRALFGDALAVLGGIMGAAYVTVGADVRRTVDTAVYASGCYGVAAVALTVACLAADRPLAGYPGATWLAIAGIVAGPQLLGHTLVNRVLRAISATSVSVAILFEVVGASVLAALWFGETPPLAAVPAAMLVLAGIVVVIRGGRHRPPEGAPLG